MSRLMAATIGAWLGFATLIISPVSSAERPIGAAEGWTTDPATGCAVWNAAPKGGQSVVFEGNCLNGRAGGNGRARWYRDGNLTSIYKGGFKAGRPHGHGIYLLTDGSQYTGGFLDGRRHGQGVRVWPNGNRFEGEFRNGKRHGPGIMDFADGLRYAGPYANGKPHGAGGCYTPDRGQWACRWMRGKLVE